MADNFHLEHYRAWERTASATGRALTEQVEAMNDLWKRSAQAADKSEGQKKPALEEYFAQRREFEKSESLKRRQSFGVGV